MSPRIVPPQEASRVHAEDLTFTLGLDLAHTVATEPDRIRAAVVVALVREARRLRGTPAEVHLMNRAQAIENGAPL